MRSRATFARAMSSSSRGPWPHHSDNRWPRTSRSSPNRRRYWKRASFTRNPARWPSVHPDAARRPIELRVAVGLVVGGIEEGATFLRTRRDDGHARHHPDADYVPPAGVDV